MAQVVRSFSFVNFWSHKYITGQRQSLPECFLVRTGWHCRQKVAPNGPCGHLLDREDKDFCDAETRKHVQMTSAILEFWASSLHLNNSHNDCADWCLVLSYYVSAQSDEYCRLWIDLKISRWAPSQRHLWKSKYPSTSDCGDWCLVSSYQVPAQSDNNCRLWIDLKISRGALPGKKSQNLELSDCAHQSLVSFRKDWS